jgi:PIN domain nuclease of toxin-antitoxin system
MHGIETMPLDEETTNYLAQLPARHNDPFERMLICTAIAKGLALVTPDPLVSKYPIRTLC